MSLRWTKLGFFLSSWTLADSCPEWILNDPSIPSCSSLGENSVYPATYPAMAHIISGNWDSVDDPPQNVLLEFVDAVLSDNLDKMPYLIVSSSSSEFELMRADLSQRLRERGLDKQKVEEAVSRLKNITSLGRHRWMQDIAEYTYNSQSGKTQSRTVSHYRGRLPSKRIESFHRQLQGILSSCGMDVGPGLPPDETVLRGSHKTGRRLEKVPKNIEAHPLFIGAEFYGGNIEALPGGICLVGNNQDYESYTRHFCPDAVRTFNVNVSWLTVGHVDEVIGVIPNPASACGYSLQVASPRKALELMAQDPRGEFIRGFSDSMHSEGTRGRGMESLCGALQAFEIEKIAQRKSETSPQARHAEPEIQELVFHSGKECWEKGFPTNKDILDLWGTSWGQRFRVSNELIQEIQDQNIVQIKLQLRNLGACVPDVVEVPNLFATAFDPVEFPGAEASDPVSRRYRLPVPAMADAIHPNPTNGVVAGKTYLLSQPRNEAFEKYLENQYAARGLKTKKIDTWVSAHLSHGNLHCSSNSVRFCRK